MILPIECPPSSFQLISNSIRFGADCLDINYTNRSTEYSLSLVFGILSLRKKHVSLSISRILFTDPGWILQLAIRNSSN